jgi:hypothetical protein
MLVYTGERMAECPAFKFGAETERKCSELDG